jgi:hypothetical protein
MEFKKTKKEKSSPRKLLNSLSLTSRSLPTRRTIAGKLTERSVSCANSAHYTWRVGAWLEVSWILLLLVSTRATDGALLWG